MSKTDKQSDGKTDPRPELPVKTAVTLSFQASRRLKAAALHEGKTQSELVEALVLKHLGGYFTSKRDREGKDEPEAPTLRIGAGG